MNNIHLSGDLARRIRITQVEETASTNTDIKKAAREGESEGAVLIARRQTAGRGRLGRSFYSPDATGLYMSVLFRPKLTPEVCTLLTPMAAVAVAEAIERVTGEKPQIKWVNDILIRGKKVAGILTEGSFSRDSMDFAVVGIGINLTEPKGGFPEDIKDIADAIGEKIIGKEEELVAELIRRLFSYYDSMESGAFIEEYRRRLVVLGRDITVHGGDESYRARAIEIDPMCRLIVERDGERSLLSSGEVSVRL